MKYGDLLKKMKSKSLNSFFSSIKEEKISFIKINIDNFEKKLIEEESRQVAQIVKKAMKHLIIPIIHYEFDFTLVELERNNLYQIMEFNQKDIYLGGIIYSFSLNKSECDEDFLKRFVRSLSNSLPPAIFGIYVLFFLIFQ